MYRITCVEPQDNTPFILEFPASSVTEARKEYDGLRKVRKYKGCLDWKLAEIDEYGDEVAVLARNEA